MVVVAEQRCFSKLPSWDQPKRMLLAPLGAGGVLELEAVERTVRLEAIALLEARPLQFRLLMVEAEVRAARHQQHRAAEAVLG